MSGFKINSFSGLFPRCSESMLPEGGATVASNCEFAYLELRNTRGGYLVNSMSNSPKSIYTDDGLVFYTWTTDVNAVRSPITNDTFNRLYYTDGSAFKVASRSGMSTVGGVPGSSYNVGVPRPTVPPVLTVIAQVIDSTTANFAYTFHYELGGVKYQEQTVAPAVVVNGSQWRFTPPTRSTTVSYTDLAAFPAVGVAGSIYKAGDSGLIYTWSGTTYVVAAANTEGTPAEAEPVLRIAATSKANGSQFYSLYTDNSSLQGTGGPYSLSMANEAGAVTFLASLSNTVKESDKITRAYVYTFVNTYGEEGPPSDPTTIDTATSMNVSAVVTEDAATGYAPIKEIRLYSTPVGSTISQYFFTKAISVLASSGAVTILDDVRAEDLNEQLSSLSYYPPDPALRGLMALPNGILCAWKGNQLHFSEAYKPWAWPPAYVKPLQSTIVSGIPHGSGAIITTVTCPYAINGVSPDSMTESRINVDQAGVSKWAIAVVDGTVMYASNDGLVVVSGGSASLKPGQRFFTRETWRSRIPAGMSGMRFAVWDGCLVVYSGTAAFTPFMVRVDEADGTMTDLPNLTAACSFVSQLSDQFYYANGNGLYQFNGGTDLTATWMSGEKIVPRPINYAFAQTVTTGAWSIEFYADGVLRHTKAVAAGVNNFRLPSGFRSDRWKLKLTGTGRFRELRMAETAGELAKL